MEIHIKYNWVIDLLLPLLQLGATTVVAVLVGIWARNSTKDQTAIEVVTKSRVEWIKEVREKNTEVFELIFKLVNNLKSGEYGTEVNFNELANSLNREIDHLKNLLNPDGEIDNEILDHYYLVINTLNYATLNYDEEKDLDICISLAMIANAYVRILLKTEWEKVKFESTGNKKKFTYQYVGSLLNEIKSLEKYLIDNLYLKLVIDDSYEEETLSELQYNKFNDLYNS